jgi:hypothetical protein
MLLKYIEEAKVFIRVRICLDTSKSGFLKWCLFDGKHNYVEEATKTKSIKNNLRARSLCPPTPARNMLRPMIMKYVSNRCVLCRCAVHTTAFRCGQRKVPGKVSPLVHGDNKSEKPKTRPLCEGNVQKATHFTTIAEDWLPSSTAMFHLHPITSRYSSSSTNSTS